MLLVFVLRSWPFYYLDWLLNCYRSPVTSQCHTQCLSHAALQAFPNVSCFTIVEIFFSPSIIKHFTPLIFFKMPHNLVACLHEYDKYVQFNIIHVENLGSNNLCKFCGSWFCWCQRTPCFHIRDRHLFKPQWLRVKHLLMNTFFSATYNPELVWGLPKCKTMCLEWRFPEHGGGALEQATKFLNHSPHHWACLSFFPISLPCMFVQVLYILCRM